MDNKDTTRPEDIVEQADATGEASKRDPILANRSDQLAVTLNYLDKVYQSCITSQTIASRCALIMQILSLLLIAISLGVISPKNESFSVPLAGIELIIPLSIFLFAGGCILAATTIAWYILVGWGYLAKRDLIRLYTNLNSRNLIAETLVYPFDYPDAYTALSYARTKTSLTNRNRIPNGLIRHFDYAVSNMAVLLLIGTPGAAQVFVVRTLTPLMRCGTSPTRSLQLLYYRF